LFFANPKVVKTILSLVVLLVGLAISPAQDSDRCSVCGGPIGGVVYLFQDKVTGEKRSVCEKCAKLNTVCYLCGVPVKDNYKELPDGRILCARDVKNVVLDENEAQHIWEDVKDTVGRQLSRFMTFPENVTVHPLDRVDLQRMFRVVGYDYTCPNVWGCTLRETNEAHRVTYEISLLRGLPPSVLKATCAHELTHTWVTENLSRERRRRIAQDAVEGFCELVAALYVESQGDQAQLGVIKSNAYTRGQFALFYQAEQQFGMNDVVDWMKFGVDARLDGNDLVRVRKVVMPRQRKTPPAIARVPTYSPPAGGAPAPETLSLKGIMWSARPVAVINDRTFMVNDENKVRLGSSNVIVRCIAIRQDAVVVRVNGASEQQTLKLPASGR
jgi:hypothetical protein